MAFLWVLAFPTFKTCQNQYCFAHNGEKNDQILHLSSKILLLNFTILTEPVLLVENLIILRV